MGVAFILPSRRASRTIRPMSRLAVVGSAILLGLALNRPSLAQDDVPDPAPAAPPVEAPALAPEEPPPPTGEPPPPIYDEKLLRLSEILGSLAFLRDLCGATDGASWRDDMNALLEAEKPPPKRRARMIARFNHGFETFNAVYRTCTPSAQLSIARYLSEGAALASDVRGRYNQ
jgi:uncharacterized protein (TIGR02301 family)